MRKKNIFAFMVVLSSLKFSFGVEVPHGRADSRIILGSRDPKFNPKLVAIAPDYIKVNGQVLPLANERTLIRPLRDGAAVMYEAIDGKPVLNGYVTPSGQVHTAPQGGRLEVIDGKLVSYSSTGDPISIISSDGRVVTPPSGSSIKHNGVVQHAPTQISQY